MKLRHLACALILSCLLLAHAVAAEKPTFSTTVEQSVKATHDKIADRLVVTIDRLEGDSKELSLNIAGEGKITEVTGEALGSWSVRQSVDGARQLVLRPKKGDQPLTKLRVEVLAEHPLKISDETFEILTLAPPQAERFQGFVRVVSTRDLKIQVVAPSGLVPVDAKQLPPPSAPAAPEKEGGIPYAKPVPGKPGFCFSPYDQYKGYIDLRGFPPGTEVKDPYSGKSFLVPEVKSASAESASAKSDESKADETEPLAFQIHGSTYTLPLKIRQAGSPGGR